MGALLQSRLTENRYSGLVQKRGERAGHILLPRTAQRIQKFARGGGTKSILPHVALHALAELGLAHPTLEHADDGGSFLIGDGVEGIGDIVLGLDLLTDFARGHQAVLGGGVEFGGHVAHARVPLRLPFARAVSAPSRWRTPRSARCRPTRPWSPGRQTTGARVHGQRRRRTRAGGAQCPCRSWPVASSVRRSPSRRFP